MFIEDQNYNLLLNYFDAFSKAGIEGVDANDPLTTELDQLMETNKQLFYISDVVLLDILHVSKSVHKLFGIEPEKISLGFFITTTHPDDVKRHNLARIRLLEIAQEFFRQKQGMKIMSTNVRARRPNGEYFNALYQAIFFYSKTPYESVFFILVITDITSYKHVHKNFHYYIGDDQRFFRFPDDELLMTGCIYTDSELRIIELIDEGLSSKEIAEKLNRSHYTINTHRTNIITKSGKRSITEVIYDLKAQGLL